MAKDPICYLVMETITGAVDGWYGKSDAFRMLEYFQGIYPKGNWAVLNNSEPYEYSGLGMMFHTEDYPSKLLEGLK